MRIALFVHCYYPEHFFGTESYTRTVARELAALGHEPTVVAATFPGEPVQAGLIERYEFDGIPVVRIDRNLHPNRNIRDTYDRPELRFIHERVLRGLRPDIVHVCHLINHTSALLDVTRALQIPTVATFTDFFGFCFNNKLEAAGGGLCAGPNALRSNCVACAFTASAQAEPTWSSPLLRHAAVSRGVAAIAARAPDLVSAWRPTVSALQDRPDHLHRAYAGYAGAIAPSRFLQRAYQDNHYPGTLELSHFGVDIDRRAKPANPSDKIRLGFIGQLASHKGPHLLLAAIRKLAPSPLSLSIWGDETQYPDYSATLREQAEGLDVTFPGTFRSEQLAGLMANIDVLVIPSTWFENSPLILLQALATHTPVVIADVEGMTEFIEDGRSGFRFARGSVSDLARKLGQFVQSPSLAARLSEQTYYERNSRAMVHDVVDLYDRVAEQARAIFRGN